MSEQKNNPHSEERNTSTNPRQSTARQEQSDPQLTELRGFINPDEDLEPTLTDGTKAPEKAKEENKAQGWK